MTKNPTNLTSANLPHRCHKEREPTTKSATPPSPHYFRERLTSTHATSKLGDVTEMAATPTLPLDHRKREINEDSYPHTDPTRYLRRPPEVTKAGERTKRPTDLKP